MHGVRGCKVLRLIIGRLVSMIEPINNAYEVQRLENIKQNQALIAELGIESKSALGDLTASRSRPSKKRRVEVEQRPSRASARIASVTSKPRYTSDDEGDTVSKKFLKKLSKKTTTTAKSIPLSSPIASVLPFEDLDVIRAGWTSWDVVAPPPDRDTDAVFHFDTYPLFTPNKSPEEMIREGSFGGSYFRPLYSRTLGITIREDWRDLPAFWTSGLDISNFLISPTYDAEVNKYKVSCGQTIEEWEAAGWINHKYDVRGWFQWYCRFFMGRRCEDDERQISRWRKCVGETGRWRRMLLKKYGTTGVREVWDDGEEEEGKEVSPVMHQTCHHWAFEVRQGVLDEYWRSGK